MKNVYLSASIVGCEDVYYSYRADKTKDSFDVAYARESEMCYGGTDLIGNSTVHFSQYVRGSYDSELLYDVRGSHHCFGCVNVRNAKHQMFNKQYSQEEYKKERKKYDLGSYKVLSAICAQFDAFKLSFPRRYAMFDQTQSVIGNNVQNARNLFHCFDTYNAENCKYVLGGISGIKDSYDVSYGGLNAELCYDGWSIVGSGNKFSTGGWGQNVEYCDACFDMGCSDLFGCVAIHSRKQYLVLNKEYSPEDYIDLVAKIKQHMVEMPYRYTLGIRYMYGEFFPYDFSVHG
ncbi:MAG: hypothetical protein HY430_04050, partial [Candidatus Levybacteria bacterium]|nr:hypothetical protein [Candidatus Levybacteria bacterium]